MSLLCYLGGGDMSVRAAPRFTCRHCVKGVYYLRPFGLCWSCYYTPGLRSLYGAR